MQNNDPFGACKTLATSSGEVIYYDLKELDRGVSGDVVFPLPFSIQVLLEALLRNCGGKFVAKEDVEALANWPESIGQSIGSASATKRDAGSRP